jgi:hypothetical protein
MAKKHSKTHKNKKGLMTIPQLRKAFDHIESFTQTLLRKTNDPKEQRKEFQKEWQKVFHRAVDDKSADSYLQFEQKKSGKRTTKKQQRGGAPLGGAPLDYSTRPGIDGVYGVFPAYVSSGLAFYNDINKLSQTEGCGIEDTTPKVPLSIGSNEVQKGGKRKNKTRKAKKQDGGAFPTLTEFGTALAFRPITSTNPTTPFYDGQMGWKGQPLPPSPAPNTANPPYMAYKPTTLAGVATEINRNLGAEIRS